MAPLEINKKIAELKGYKFIKGPFAYATLGKMYPHGWQYPNGNIKLGIPNWSESIADAWELFDEMPAGYIVGKDCDSKWLVYDSIKQFQEDHFESDSAPMAICLAWLKWKE